MTISRVACIACASYERDIVHAAVLRGIDLLGGTSCFVKSGETVLLKPNALSASEPSRCIVTHPAVLDAVFAAFSQSECTLVYGDSPALNSTRGKSLPTMEKCGYTGVAKTYGAQLADMDNGKSVQYAGGGVGKAFTIANGVLAADGVISISKLKTHGLTNMTGAVKNQYGCVPGTYKGQYHARLPDVRDFSRLIVDITAFVAPRLFVMDAVMAMEGNGPGSGDPRFVGMLLLSTDPVALDAAAGRLIGIDAKEIPTCIAGKEAGLGTYDFANIEMAGDDWQQFVVRDFSRINLPPLTAGRAGPLFSAIRSAVIARPKIDKQKCTRCGVCVSACPLEPKALAFSKKASDRKIPPRYAYNRCIRCYCCQECCPSRAITIQTPIAGRLLPMLSYLSLLLSNVRAKRAAKRNANVSRG